MKNTTGIQITDRGDIDFVAATVNSQLFKEYLEHTLTLTMDSNINT